MRRDRFTEKFVRGNLPPGRYFGPNGLVLLVRASGRRYWEQRISAEGRRLNVGVGRYPVVDVAGAQKIALHNLVLVDSGEHPAQARGRRPPTFGDAARTVIALRAKEWTGPQTQASWTRSLRLYVFPHLESRLVCEVTAAQVLAVLSPIWATKHATAEIVRQRIGVVMQWAIHERYRQDNPADTVLAALPHPRAASSHHRALPYAKVPAALAAVRASGAPAIMKLVIEFLVLTAARPGEARGARWSEIDLERRLWTIPEHRMKMRIAHRVPLSAPALSVLCEARHRLAGPDLVFPSSAGAPLGAALLVYYVRRIGLAAVPHGFRSSFRDWCAETGVAREVAEQCLAHSVGNAVEQAYRRTDVLQRRTKVMEDWGRYAISRLSDDDAGSVED